MPVAKNQAQAKTQPAKAAPAVEAKVAPVPTRGLPQVDSKQDDAAELASIEGLLGIKSERAHDSGGDTTPAAPDEEAAEGESPAAEGEAESERIDYKLKIPMPDGADPVTLGELKDFYQKRSKTSLEQIEAENKTMQEREAAETLLRYVEDLPPEVRARAQNHAIRDYTKEMTLLQHAVPESKTPEGMAAMKKAILGLTDSYGVDPRAVERVMDHTTIKMLYDYARLRESVKAAKGLVKPLRSVTPQASGKAASNPNSELQSRIDRAKRTRNDLDEAAAVDALLRGK